MTRFKFSTEELELLSAFEQLPSLEAVSNSLGKDPTVVSRMLKRIAEKSPVLEKVSGRWKITDTGRKLNSITKDLCNCQNAILEEEVILRIGSNREFIPRVLVPSLEKLKARLNVSTLIIKSFESGTENPLLNGQIDIALDCGRPYASDIAFKSCAPEPMSIVCSPKFLKKHKENFTEDNFLNLPMIYCDRLGFERFDTEKTRNLRVDFHFNDISAARAACVQGLGWMLIPSYAVCDEIDKKLLVKPFDKDWGFEKYGVWWMRSRKHLSPYIKIFEEWLSELNLEKCDLS